MRRPAYLMAMVLLGFASGASAQRRASPIAEDVVRACFPELEPGRAIHSTVLTIGLVAARRDDGGANTLELVSLDVGDDYHGPPPVECIQSALYSVTTTMRPGTRVVQRVTVRFAADPDRVSSPILTLEDARAMSRGRAGDVCGWSTGTGAAFPTPARCGSGLVCCYPCGIPGCESRCESSCSARP